MKDLANGAAALAATFILAACQSDNAEPVAGTATGSAVETAATGEILYNEHCASCHNGAMYKSPHKMFLAMMAPDAIFESMSGIMAVQAKALTEEQKVAVADLIAGVKLDSQAAPKLPPACDDTDIDLQRPPTQNGWGIDAGNTRFQSATSGGLTAEQAEHLELKWSFAYPNAIQARSQPTVAGGTVFVGSQAGHVYALDMKTACVRWVYRASAEVRTAIIISNWAAGDTAAEPVAYFGDILARAYALNARTGELLWMAKVDDHPNATITASPALHNDRLFVSVSSLEVILAADPSYACCTFRGSMVALDTATGEIAWKTYTIDEEAKNAGTTSAGTAILAPSGAPIWNTAAIDEKRGLLYAGTGENYTSPAGGTSDAIIAFDIETGAIRWINQATAGDAWNVGCLSDYAPDPANCPEENGPDFDYAAASMSVTLNNGSTLLVAGQKSGEVRGLDPDTGETIWQTKVGRGGVQGGVHFGMAAGDGRVFVPISDKIYPEDVTRYNFKIPARPGLFALDAATGEELWEHPAKDVCPESSKFCDPGISAAITAIPGAVVAGHMDGRLRIYANEDGTVLWEFDTRREFESVSGEKTRGGSIGGGGPAIAGGMLFINSGYGTFFHMPGNALLAFGPKE